MRNERYSITGCDTDTMKDATMKYSEEGGMPVVNKPSVRFTERMGAAGFIVLGILVICLVFGVIVPKFSNNVEDEVTQEEMVDAGK
ncbi:MAG: hypothetical protein MJ166_03340 [Clostridia bacterium]|nr:hypothetical protein [Clostridia bacterium]